MDDARKVTLKRTADVEEITRFTESYASFNRIINSLQRKYIELKDEFTAQNEQLAEANRKLVLLTERNLAATEFLNSILDSLSAGVIAVDRNGVVTHFNPAASLIMDVPREETLGKPYRDVIAPGDPPHVNALRAAETNREADSVEKKIDLPDGRRLHLSVSTAIVRDGEGRPIGAVEVFQDLTKIKRMERELARLNTLATLGEMAATIAHEVRNPLSGIAGFAALLVRDLDESDPNRATAKKIIKGVETLNNTVATLLNYTRFQEINRTEVDYEEFLANTIGRFKLDNRDKTEKVEIVLCSDETKKTSPTCLSVDTILLRQVFFNILENAVEAVGQEGRVEITFQRLSRQEARTRYSNRILLGTDETVAETVISDNGPGIGEKDLEHVFAPFFSTRPGGNGLGLAVVRKIIKAHGGEIFADRGSQGGAAFHLLFPTKMENVSMERSQ